MRVAARHRPDFSLETLTLTNKVTPTLGWVDVIQMISSHNQGRPWHHPPPRWGRPVAQPTDARIYNACMKHERSRSGPSYSAFPRGGSGEAVGPSEK